METNQNSILLRKPLTDEEEAEYQKKIVERIHHDDELSALLLKDNKGEEVFNKSLNAFISFLNDKAVCSKCTSYSACPKVGRKGYCFKLKFSPYMDCYEVVSSYCYKYGKIKKALSNIVYSDIEPISSYYAYSSLKNDIPEQASKKEGTLMYATTLAYKRVLLNSSKKSFVKGLFFNDKTVNANHIMMSLAFSECLKGRKVALVDAGGLLNDCNSPLEDVRNDALTYLDKLYEADTLFIFNLGTEYKNSSFRDKVIFPILQRRLAISKMTFISSSFSLSSICSSYSHRKDDISTDLYEMFIKLTDPVELKDFSYF